MSAAKRKRRETFGSLRKLPSGRYQASYVGPDGVRHNAPSTFTTMTDARAFLRSVQDRIALSTWQSPDDEKAARHRDSLTFGAYAETWLGTRFNSKGEPLRPTTMQEYRRLLAAPLAPFAQRPLSAVTRAEVEAWRASLLATGRRTQTASAYGLLKSIYASALENDLITATPCTIKGGATTVTGRKVAPPSDDELDVIVASITPRFRALVLVAAWGGLRYGEATELRRKDVRIKRRAGEVVSIALSVERAVVHITGEGFKVGPPKSDSGVRVVELPSFVFADVLTHLDEHTGRFGESLLFPGADGANHLMQSSFTRYWYPARKAAGREDMPFHALRHFAGTRYAATGATLRDTMARLGHSSTGAAMRYQHETGRSSELVAKMARRVAD